TLTRPTEEKGQAPECAKAIQMEVQKLVKAGIMREVYYHDWLSNPVMVKKHDGSWRMCVDFTNLTRPVRRILILFQKLTEKLSLFAATPSNVSWMPTKVIIILRWQRQIKRKQLSTPVKGYIAIQKCLLALKTLSPHTSG
ncbi:hypothetical protein Tco_1450831, partial [Tanacetum coccineum]